MARLAAENRCRDVVVLDLREISPVTDFFVVATGTSRRQMQTVLAKVADALDNAYWRTKQELFLQDLP